MVRDGEGRARGAARLPAVAVFWVGFLATVAIAVLNAFANIFPALPSIPLMGR